MPVYALDGIAPQLPEDSACWIAPTAVVVNEILASNTLDLADPQGEHDDWIELYNTGTVAVDVGGCYLTDDLSRPTRWQIPTDTPGATTIPAS